MKTKLLFSFLLSISLIGCSVDPIEEVTEDSFDSVNSSVDDYGCAGPDSSKIITISEARSIESWDEVRKLYLSLLSPEVSRNGSFDPSIWELIDAFADAENPLGVYTTIYTLDTDSCSDSVELSIEVVEDFSDPICGISAGEDSSKEITLTEAKNIESWDEVRKLYLNLLAPGVPRNGSFDPSIWNLIDAFAEAEDPLGDYSTVYTITDGDCSDSVVLTITVVPDSSDPICTLSAGPDNIKTMTVSEAAALPSWDEVRKQYLSLLAEGVPRDGTFDPSIWNLIDAFAAAENPVGDYTTIYTITDGECSDSVELTIRVVAD